jgi:hypothetical protein
MLGNDEKGQKAQVSVEKNPYFSIAAPNIPCQKSSCPCQKCGVRILIEAQPL